MLNMRARKGVNVLTQASHLSVHYRLSLVSFHGNTAELSADETDIDGPGDNDELQRLSFQDLHVSPVHRQECLYQSHCGQCDHISNDDGATWLSDDIAQSAVILGG